MHVFQDLCSDDSMQVRLHKIKHQIDIFVIFGLDQMLQAHNVGVPV